MDIVESFQSPSSHTPAGGVLLGSATAMSQMIVYEDPQCPYCRRFEEQCGEVLQNTRHQGILATEFRMRSFLGPESVRANNALALAAEEHGFDELRQELFRSQPPEGTGGFTPADLLVLGQRVGLTSASYVSGVNDARFESWVLASEAIFQEQDPQGTPAAWLDGELVDPRVLNDPEALGVLLRA
jgi:Thioredoxin